MIPAVRRFLLLVALYTGAVLAAIGPPLGAFGSEFISTGLPGYGEAASGDHLQAAYRFWLVGHQLLGGHAPWIDPYSFQPLVDPQVVFGGWPFGLAFWPLDALFGSVPAWNLLLVLVAVACGLLTFAWLEELDLPPWSAALGGLAFAVAPYRLAQSGPHLLGWAAVFLPLALLAVERSRRVLSPTAAHAWGGIAALALVSIPLSGQLHLALGALPFVLLYALVRFRGTTAIWVGVGVLAAVGAGFLVNATTIAGSTEAGARPLSEVATYSADWLDFVSRGRRGGFEQFVYLGWLTPLLAAAGLVLLARRRLALAALLGLGAVVPVLLALGTHFPLYELVRDALPPFRGPRVPGRLLPVADLALAALAAVAAAFLVERVQSGRRAIVAAALVVLVAADLTVFPLHSSAADPDNESYALLDRSPRGACSSCRFWSGARGSWRASTCTTACRRPGSGLSATPRPRRKEHASSWSGSTGSTAASGSPGTRPSSHASGSATSSCTVASTASRGRKRPSRSRRKPWRGDWALCACFRPSAEQVPS